MHCYDVKDHGARACTFLFFSASFVWSYELKLLTQTLMHSCGPKIYYRTEQNTTSFWLMYLSEICWDDWDLITVITPCYYGYLLITVRTVL